MLKINKKLAVYVTCNGTISLLADVVICLGKFWTKDIKAKCIVFVNT